MINRFRALNPFNILWLCVFLIVMRVGFSLKHPQHIEFTLVEPFARLLIPVAYENFFTLVNSLLVASVFIFIQALWLNHIVNSYNLIGKPTFLPALMYIVLSALLPPFLLLSPPIICNFLVILMIDKLLSFYKHESAKNTAYDLGMIVGIGTLIYFPYIYMFLAIWVGFLIFRPFHWREWASVLVGFATVFFFLAVFYYWNDRLDDFFKIWVPLTNSFPSQVSIKYSNYLVLIPVIIIFILAFYVINKNFFKSYVQVRKSFQLLVVVIIVSCISFYTKTNFNLSHFMLCLVPSAIIFSYYFLNARLWWFYESIFVLLVFSIIYFQFNTF